MPLSCFMGNVFWTLTHSCYYKSAYVGLCCKLIHVTIFIFYSPFLFFLKFSLNLFSYLTFFMFHNRNKCRSHIFHQSLLSANQKDFGYNSSVSYTTYLFSYDFILQDTPLLPSAREFMNAWFMC